MCRHNFLGGGNDCYLSPVNIVLKLYMNYMKLFKTSNIQMAKVVKYTLVSTCQVSLLTGSLRSFCLQMSMFLS